MDPAQLGALLALLTAGLLSPGPDFLLILRNALAGPRRSAGTVAGIAVGLAVMTSTLVGALAAAARYAPAAIPAAALAGAAWLGWVGSQALRGALASAATADAAAAIRVSDTFKAGFLDGLVCNLTNAKAFLFFAGLFGALAGPGGSPSGWLPVVVVLHATVCWSLLAALLHLPPIRCRLVRHQRLLLGLFGAGLIFIAVAVATETLLR